MEMSDSIHQLQLTILPPNLARIEFHGDRGYFSEITFLSILLQTGCLLTCTCPKGNWLPFVLGKNITLAEGDKRLVLPEDGMMTCEVREKKFKSGNHENTLAIIGLRTGTGKVVLVASTNHRRLSMDFITVNWTYLDEIHPYLLRGARHFPQSGAQLRSALNDREISLAFAFSPNEVVSSISRGELAPSTRSYVFESGTLSNVSFVAIPNNAPSKQGAMIVSNFLLSPEVQFKAATNAKLASESVLSFENFTPKQQAVLLENARAPGAVLPNELARKIQEPHPSWTNELEREWLRRYGGGR